MIQEFILALFFFLRLMECKTADLSDLFFLNKIFFVIVDFLEFLKIAGKLFFFDIRGCGFELLKALWIFFHYKPKNVLEIFLFIIENRNFIFLKHLLFLCNFQILYFKYYFLYFLHQWKRFFEFQKKATAMTKRFFKRKA